MSEDIEQNSVQTLAEESERLNDDGFGWRTSMLSFGDRDFSAWDQEPHLTDSNPMGNTSVELETETPPLPSQALSNPLIVIQPVLREPQVHSRTGFRSISIRRTRYKDTHQLSKTPLQDAVSSASIVVKTDSHKRLLEAVIASDLVEPPKTKLPPIRLFKSNGLKEKEAYERPPLRGGRLEPTLLQIHRRTDGLNSSVEDRRSFNSSPADSFLYSKELRF